MKIAIIGGGPAGLYFARLRKLYHPSDEVVVFEQNACDVTYGFGVGIAETAAGRYEEADPELMDRIHDASISMPNRRIWIDQESYLLRSNMGSSAIRRQTLLETIQAACEEVGVQTHFGVRISDVRGFDDYDLVVGSDGANSLVRSSDREFKVRTQTLTNHFAWFGVNRSLPESGLSFRSRGQWRMIAHYYPYTSSQSTFVAEVDDQTWTEGGFGLLSNNQRREYFEDTFADVLTSEELIENKSIWRQFRTVEANRWYSGNRVLLGDALYVAHFSIGSGTRLAMDDALALHNALEQNCSDVSKSLPAFERDRRPSREKLMAAARRSYDWYEDFRCQMELPLMDFIRKFMKRTGRMTDERLEREIPEFMRQYFTN